jgi:hypothetical protein
LLHETFNKVYVETDMRAMYNQPDDCKTQLKLVEDKILVVLNVISQVLELQTLKGLKV